MNLSFGLDRWLGGIILVGFTEEIVFRGFLFQKLMEFTSFWKANLITSLLFLIIHFPKWYAHGLFESVGIIGRIIFIFMFSIIQGKIFNKTNSLWTCIIVHSLNNFIGFTLR
ncbi:CPBP family intramembrane glutamic endopeptidase [Tepidibacter aestuarii]|uniref:CPBP family intramembrane glutamic endopeptidase n=1 Tax=Tepidibacter aestuarii TaxID=2925782 RepID=UPI0020BDF0CD|nr:CPBP family intramembrane glutamic endopeptidase [Tepidibacter aestuarii]